MIRRLLKSRLKRRTRLYIKRYEIAKSTRKTLVYLTVIFLVHTALMIQFEGLSAGDAAWLTLTTATTVGYGDLSAQTLEGRLATVFILYLGGIFIFAKFSGEYFEGRLERRNRMTKGLWRWNMIDHLVIINTPTRGGNNYFVRLINQLRLNKLFQEMPIQILTRTYPDGLPDELHQMGVVHYHGFTDKAENLMAVSISEASAIVILANDEFDTSSDALTFDILHRLKENNVRSTQILAECVDDANRQRFYSAGATAVVRPVRAYPEMLVRALVAPGSEKVLENLFREEGDHTKRYDINLENLSWQNIVTTMVTNGFGTPIAVEDEDGQMMCNPDPSELMDVKAIIMLVRSENVPDEEQVRGALS